VLELTTLRLRVPAKSLLIVRAVAGFSRPLADDLADAIR
jgi:hypothetical protein